MMLKMLPYYLQISGLTLAYTTPKKSMHQSEN